MTNALMNSQKLLQHAQDINKFMLDKIPAQRKGNGHKLHSCPRRYLKLIPVERGNNNILHWSDTGYINHNPGHDSFLGTISQYRRVSMFFVFILLLVMMLV